MRRLASVILAVVLSSSCANLQQDLTLAAQEQVKNTLAKHFLSAFGNDVGNILAGLAKSGGYLDNPLVRIVLPPPLLLAIDVSRALTADPKAPLLDVLINQAAEQAIPNAAPILRAALAQVTTADVRALLDGGKSAATDYLKARTAAALRDALTPLVKVNLAASGAQQLYDDLLAANQARQDAVSLPPAAPMPELAHAVAGQAVEGIYKVMSEREALLRENIDTVTGGVLEGIE